MNFKAGDTIKIIKKNSRVSFLGIIIYHLSIDNTFWFYNFDHKEIDIINYNEDNAFGILYFAEKVNKEEYNKKFLVEIKNSRMLLVEKKHPKFKFVSEFNIAFKNFMAKYF